MDNTKIILETKQLAKSYSGFTMNDICFAVKEGEIHGLIGNNGAGKTTMLKCLMNMIGYEGQIYFRGALLSQKAVEYRRYIGYVGDFDLAYRDIKLKDIYSFTKNIYGQHWDGNKFKYLIGDLFGIDLNHKVQSLSTGTKKKFWLALALSHNPKLLLLDEPTTGIDPDSRGELLEFIVNMAKTEDTAVIFSTHIIEDLEKIADNVMVIKNGRLVFNDTKNAYFEKRSESNVN